MNDNISEDSKLDLKEVIGELFYDDLSNKLQNWDTEISKINDICNETNHIKRQSGEILDYLSSVKKTGNDNKTSLEEISSEQKEIKANILDNIPKLIEALNSSQKLLLDEFENLNKNINNSLSELDIKGNSLLERNNALHEDITKFCNYVKEDIPIKLGKLESNQLKVEQDNNKELLGKIEKLLLSGQKLVDDKIESTLSNHKIEQEKLSNSLAKIYKQQFRSNLINWSLIGIAIIILIMTLIK